MSTWDSESKLRAQKLPLQVRTWLKISYMRCGGKAANLRGVYAFRGGRPSQEHLKRRGWKGERVKGWGSVKEALGPRALDGNGEDAPVAPGEARAERGAEGRGGLHRAVQHEGANKVHAFLVAAAANLAGGHHKLDAVSLA